MSGVRGQALSRRSLLAAVGASITLAGCGAAADADRTSSPEVLLGERPGKLTCTDWRNGLEAERRGTLGQLHALASGNANPAEVGPNRVLDDDAAYEVLQTACSRTFARGFLLYEVYNRSAAFSLDPDG